MKRRLKYIQKSYSRGEVGLDEARSTIMSYLGFMQHANCYRLKQKVLKNFVLNRE